MAAPARFQLTEVLFESVRGSGEFTTLKPNERLPEIGKGYAVDLKGTKLYIQAADPKSAEEDQIGFIAADKDPSDAKAFGLSVIGMVTVCKRSGNSKILVIKRSETLSTFPGMMSFPGGFVDPADTSVNDTVLREIKEELGEGWLNHVEILNVSPCVVIDSVPTPSRHNITIVMTVTMLMDASIDSFEGLIDMMTLDPNEVAAVYFCDVDAIGLQTHHFTPGIRKLLEAK